VLGWEDEIRTVNVQINKILDMMGYVKGNFITRNARKTMQATKRALYGINRKRGLWVEEEAVDMLDSAVNDFVKSLEEENERHSARAASLKRLNEEVANSAGDPGVRRGLFKEKRFNMAKRNALGEIKKGKKEFITIRKLLNDLAGRIAVEQGDYPEITMDGFKYAEKVTYVVIASGSCDDQPGRRKASKYECEKEISPALGGKFTGGSYYRPSTPAGCLQWPSGKLSFKDSFKPGGACGVRNIKCVCAMTTTNITDLTNASEANTSDL